jgi:hypothetical protein
VIKRSLQADYPAGDLSLVKRLLEDRLPRELVTTWQRRVLNHLEHQPFEKDELDTLSRRVGRSAVQDVQANPLLAYGSTLLATIVTPDFVALLQIGDGDILLVSEEREVYRPVPPDLRLLGNATTSLCSSQAWLDFRSAFIPLANHPPALIMLSTDGYANSFSNDDNFLQVGADFLDILRTQGEGAVRANLPDWLDEATHSGSGDDITTALIYRK